MKIEVDVPDDLLTIMSLIERAQTLAVDEPKSLQQALVIARRECAHRMAQFALVGIEESR